MTDRYIVLLDQDRDERPDVVVVRAVRATLDEALRVREIGAPLWVLPAGDYRVARRTHRRYVNGPGGDITDGGVFRLERRAPGRAAE